MTRFVYIFILVACFSFSTFIQAQESAKIPCQERALSFFHWLQTDLKQNNPELVTTLIHYPLRADLNGHARMIRTKAEFIKKYSSIFTPARIEAIIKTKDSEVWYRDQGYSIPYGVVWFDRFLSPGKHWPEVNSGNWCNAGKFGVETVNPAKEEAR